MYVICASRGISVRTCRIDARDDPVTMWSVPDMTLLTPNADEKLRSLRRMKLIATGAFVLMTAVFFLSESFGRQTVFWVIRWDHINAFAEASMVGALADWFAVVALFRHPLGIPIWHTAIIPRKKDEIGRNLGNFVETRLLSVENLSREIGRFSVADAVVGFLHEPGNRERAAGWLREALANIVRTLDDDQIESTIASIATDKLKELNASGLLGRGLDALVESNRHQELIDHTLVQMAEWVPSRRETIREFIERSAERTLRWGSRFVPNAVINRATDQTLNALIEVLQEAARDTEHPLRADLDARVRDWATRLKDDPEWTERINTWKDEAVDHPRVRGAIGGFWAQTKQRILEGCDDPESELAAYALRAVESFHDRLSGDPQLRELLDTRLRDGAITLLARNQGAIGSVIKRIVDAWDAEQLSRELELNLGRDLQYIRLNGTFIGGMVGLLIHLVR